MATVSAINSSAIKMDAVPTHLSVEPSLPPERKKTLMSVGIALFCMVLNCTALSVVHDHVPDTKPLPDLFLDNVPAQDWALYVSEVCIMVLTTSTVIMIVCHKHRYIVLRRVMLLLALLYLMRAITMVVTTLPVASTTYYCSPKENHTSFSTVMWRTWQLSLGMGLSINGKHTYCGDYIYSGHTTLMVLCYLVLAEYCPRQCAHAHWLAGLVTLLGVLLLLISHGHYTVDVIIAYYVTTTLFWTYHTLANNAQLKERGIHNQLARAWWYLGFRYFEKNVEGLVPRKYDWPLPWPKRCHGSV